MLANWLNSKRRKPVKPLSTTTPKRTILKNNTEPFSMQYLCAAFALHS
jgi:hypothetical protein